MMTREKLDKYRKQIYRRPVAPTIDSATLGRRKWWWVYGHTRTGKRAFLGPFHEEEEAIQRASGLEDIQTFDLRTRSQSEAVRQMRALLLADGKTPDDAIQRQLHEKGLAREAQR